ncbi:MAG: alpha/beta fold hydrolase [Candidatus Bathyarchaeota archaeon]|nr:MAG: alpha/beta fold hydrolase [Candidatus Bathyarchaeota archaeon]
MIAAAILTLGKIIDLNLPTPILTSQRLSFGDHVLKASSTKGKMNWMVFERERHTKNALFAGFLVILLLSSFPQASCLKEEAFKRRDLAIDLGGGLTTDAQLTLPSVGDGPFPGVLLVHGSGNTDMDEYLPPEVSGTEEGSRPFLQIAEYLSERGFAVLRYNKRGIGMNGTVLDLEVVTNTVFGELQHDAERALEILMQQPEVEADDITIIGHSEGTWIAIRITIEEPGVKNIVLMSAAAHNLKDLLYYQLVERNIDMFQEIDSDHDGSISIQEVYVLPPVLADALIENSTGDWLWLPGIDQDEDGYVSISEELVPLWEQTFEYLTTAEFPGCIWFRSHFGLRSNLDLIGNVSSGILILQGEGDTQTPVEGAFLLEQRLTEVGHPDHTLITYPGLGHSFYPVEGLVQWLGPIQEQVLSDLASWLRDPARGSRDLEAKLQTAESTIEALLGQLGDLSSELAWKTSELEGLVEELQSESSSLKNSLAEAESDATELESALDSYRNLTYVALGIAAIAIAVNLVLILRRRPI